MNCALKMRNCVFLFKIHDFADDTCLLRDDGLACRVVSQHF